MSALRGKLHSRIGDQEAEIGLGKVWHAPPNVEPITAAPKDAAAICVKNGSQGHGHRLSVQSNPGEKE